MVYSHLQHVAYGLVLVEHLQNLVFVAGAVALFAKQVYVAHKLHAHGNVAFTLASVATAAVHIKGEKTALVTTRLGQRLLRIEGAHLVENLHVGSRIAA